MFTWRHRLTLLYLNVVKFVRRQIDEIVRYLPHQKISASSQTVATARIAPKICQASPPFVWFWPIVYRVFAILARTWWC